MSEENTAEQPKIQPEIKDTPKTPEKDKKTGQLIEAGHEFAKKKADIELERKKPGEETLEEQQAAAKEAFEASIEEEMRALEAETEAETGEDISEEEVGEMTDTMKSIFEEMSPELAEYLEDISPRLDHLITETSQLRQEGNDKEALEKLSTFLEDEDKYIEKNVKNEALRTELQGYIRAALNADEIVKEMEAQTWKEIKSDVVDLVPVIGPAKMMREAAKGVTAGGEKLEGKGRAWHAAKAAGSLVIDGVAVAGLLTGGTVSAVAEGGKAAASGGKVASIAAKVGIQGVEVAASVKRFAALTRKTTKLTGAARKIYKCGLMIGKYPKLTASVVTLLNKREDIAKLYKKGKKGKDFAKKMGNVPAAFPANSNNLPEAPSKAA